ncbi:ATP-binding protein [Halohasta salina]|uniref:ATP-binding protein n=1 Tax=Halohasta salina TaxID=2961621 RepID=UPI0020A5FF9E|nr:ATP-binding protein [Halohasta salina]
MTPEPDTAAAARETLYEIIRSDDPFESKARQALDVGRAFLDADRGYLARVDADTEYWEVLATAGPGDASQPESGLDYEMSYCRRTLTEGTVVLHDAPTQGWADDPAFEAQGLHCYHGTRIVVDGEPYGTVCFVAEAPREQFSECESLFAELVARLLERELERHTYETELTRQTNLSTVLNRVLRHNLRNKLSVVRGYTQLLADRTGDEDLAAASGTAIDTVDDLIELCEKARKLDRIVGSETDPEPIDLSALVTSVAETVDAQYPAATVRVDGEESVTGQVVPSLERALTELVENAAKHGGEAPTVTVRLRIVSNDIEIQISDDGPGIADHEVAVLESGAETPLIHGSGLGLWLAHWIVTGHGGSIEATTAETGTTMTVRLPQAVDQAVDAKVTELASAHDQYQAAFEACSDAMVIVDADSRIVEANPAAADIFGLDHRELLGRSIAEFLPEEFDFEAAWERFRANQSERDTVAVVGADGTRRPVEYTATRDIVPGHHLIVSRVRAGHPDQ